MRRKIIDILEGYELTIMRKESNNDTKYQVADRIVALFPTTLSDERELGMFGVFAVFMAVMVTCAIWGAKF